MQAKLEEIPVGAIVLKIIILLGEVITNVNP
jgi:hypothetical protein